MDDDWLGDGVMGDGGGTENCCDGSLLEFLQLNDGDCDVDAPSTGLDVTACVSSKVLHNDVRVCAVALDGTGAPSTDSDVAANVSSTVVHDCAEAIVCAGAPSNVLDVAANVSSMALHTELRKCAVALEHAGAPSTILDVSANVSSKDLHTDVRECAVALVCAGAPSSIRDVAANVPSTVAGEAVSLGSAGAPSISLDVAANVSSKVLHTDLCNDTVAPDGAGASAFILGNAEGVSLSVDGCTQTDGTILTSEEVSTIVNDFGRSLKAEQAAERTAHIATIEARLSGLLKDVAEYKSRMQVAEAQVESLKLELLASSSDSTSKSAGANRGARGGNRGRKAAKVAPTKAAPPIRGISRE